MRDEAKRNVGGGAMMVKPKSKDQKSLAPSLSPPIPTTPAPKKVIIKNVDIYAPRH
ncbi:hypothetical protein SESBI_21758 [Sesbania bispinosa]|nr:hypothetical protein SESBI_21758 [Sesbania bispinosa]